jgi:hypothetical protein
MLTLAQGEVVLLPLDAVYGSCHLSRKIIGLTVFLSKKGGAGRQARPFADGSCNLISPPETSLRPRPRSRLGSLSRVGGLARQARALIRLPPHSVIDFSLLGERRGKTMS